MARLNKTWKVTTDGPALAAALHEELAISHRQAKGLIDASCVAVNGQVVMSYGLRLKQGDIVLVKHDPARFYQPIPKPKKGLQDAGWKMLWEDRHLLFVDKPAGLLTVPAENHNAPSLADAITDSYRRRGFTRFHLYIVHRLDRHTSGVLVFAKTPEALHHLKDLFAAHKLQRVYKAILVGELPENAGTLTDKLVERTKSLKMAVLNERAKDTKGAQRAITHYRVVERLPGHTVVEVRLETGRRNQIRVQFADRGFPLLGDQVYGSKSELIDRQALHAELLGFAHPVSGDPITVLAPMPADLEKALKSLRLQQRLKRAEEGRVGSEGIFQPKITREKRQVRVLKAKKFTREDGDAKPTERGPASGRKRPAGPARSTDAKRPGQPVRRPERGVAKDRPFKASAKAGPSKSRQGSPRPVASKKK